MIVSLYMRESVYRAAAFGNRVDVTRPSPVKFQGLDRIYGFLK